MKFTDKGVKGSKGKGKGQKKPPLKLKTLDGSSKPLGNQDKKKKGYQIKDKIKKSREDKKNKNKLNKKPKSDEESSRVVVKGSGEEEERFIEFQNDDEDDQAVQDHDDELSNRKKKKAGGFHALGLSPQVLKGIFKRGYKIPTPIQRKAIPAILDGKDVVAMARTGSGKTAAFLLPMFEKLEVKKVTIGSGVQKYPRAIILSPTRELATQTLRFIKELSRFLNFKIVSVLGGDSMESQFSALSDKPDIIVATPGRLMHVCVEMELKLDGVQYVVFDEADRLFEMGFGEQLSEILNRLPENKQTVLFSATLPKLLVEFTKAGLHDPQLIRLDVDNKLSDALTLSYFGCRSEDKLAVLLYLLKNILKLEEQTLIFAATKHHVEFLHAILDENEIPNCYIYSSLDPSARKISLGKFRNKKVNVLIVTDIAARGLDIPILDNVINFHFPPKPKLFIHRVGRVARAGRSGTAYSIVSPDELAFLFDLHLFLGKPIKFKESNDPEAIVVGQIPQSLIDEEINVLRKLMEVKYDLVALNKVGQNGYKQYLKSRPNASTESNRRAKEIDVTQLPIHHILKDSYKGDPMNNWITQMKKYRPNSTIFEIGPKAGSEKHKIMQLKRIKDQLAIDKHRGAKQVTANEINGNSDNEENSISESNPGKKDKENFINYLPKDHATESALSVGSTFDKQIQDSMMDLTGDDTDYLKKQSGKMKWDRKKKKFITSGHDNKKGKKIQTESGTWITSSFKGDRYKNWKDKSKSDMADSDDDDNDNNDGDNFNKRAGADNRNFKKKPTFSKKLVKTGKNAAPQNNNEQQQQSFKGKRFKTGIKKPEEILKDRKEKAKKLWLQSGGLKSKGKGKGKKVGGNKGGFRPGKGKR